MATSPGRPAGPPASTAPGSAGKDDLPRQTLAEHLSSATMDQPPISGVPRAAFLRSFVFAWNGLVYSIRTQRNARIHALIGTCAIILGLILRISPVEFAMVFVAITLVFIAEMFNTVAEACVDLATQEYNPLARIAKDVAAGAVLLNAMLSVVIGLLVFGPHLLALLVQFFRR
jgi:diacylglycerol kinase